MKVKAGAGICGSYGGNYKDSTSSNAILISVIAEYRLQHSGTSRRRTSKTALTPGNLQSINYVLTARSVAL